MSLLKGNTIQIWRSEGFQLKETNVLGKCLQIVYSLPESTIWLYNRKKSRAYLKKNEKTDILRSLETAGQYGHHWEQLHGSIYTDHGRRLKKTTLNKKDVPIIECLTKLTVAKNRSMTIHGSRGRAHNNMNDYRETQKAFWRKTVPVSLWWWLHDRLHFLQLGQP